MEKSIIKNGRVHIEGQKNERIATCLHCESKIRKNQGFKILGYGSYGFVHIDCRNDYYQDIERFEKTYSHGIAWMLEVKSNYKKLEGLQSMGWTIDKLGNAMILINTLNRLKSLKNIEGMAIKITILLPNSEDTKLLKFPNIGYDKLRNKVIIETKKALYFKKYGTEKKDFTDFPNFDI